MVFILLGFRGSLVQNFNNLSTYGTYLCGNMNTWVPSDLYLKSQTARVPLKKDWKGFQSKARAAYWDYGQAKSSNLKDVFNNTSIWNMNNVNLNNFVNRRRNFEKGDF